MLGVVVLQELASHRLEMTVLHHETYRDLIIAVNLLLASQLSPSSGVGVQQKVAVHHYKHKRAQDILQRLLLYNQGSGIC